MSFVVDVIIFLYSELETLFPNNGTAFLLIAMASNTPSHNIIGAFQLIKFSKNTISLEASGFLYLK